jgi:LCP family protein required for cell wall assembly
MHESQEARPRARSPFTAAFLSLLFPGLGQWYAGATTRALGFAAAPILLIALLAGVGLRMDRIAMLGLVFDPNVLNAVFVLNIVVLIYRVVAVVDAYRVAEFMNAQAASGDGRAGRARLRRNPLSIAGLLAVLLVMAASHVVVARYDSFAMELVDRGCDSIFIGEGSTEECPDPEATASPSAEPSESEDIGEEPTATPTPEASLVGTPVPNVSIAPWDGKERLNILLIGADEQGGGHNTDTLIVVSIDPVTKQVAMFSLPRDTVDVPIPDGPARQVWGRDYSGKINSFFANNRKRSDLWPGNDRTRGYNALKSVLGELYDLDIKYFVEVNFEGFKQVVDAVGGVTINVQIPVSDDRFPSERGRLVRLYIPSGIQHMDGAEALKYARSRHSSTDFDRGQRQQRVLLSLREQADPQHLIPRLPELVAALKKTVRTDIPLSQMDELLGLASEVDTKDIRSYVFAPPLYARESSGDSRGYVIIPNIERIRDAVKDAFSSDPADEALRQTLAAEGAGVWVLNGTGDGGRGADLAGYLDYHGVAASAPRQKPDGAVPANTRIIVYNGAEATIPETIAYLEKTFGVKVSLKDDPAVRTDVVITIGNRTPTLSAPAGA